MSIRDIISNELLDQLRDRPKRVTGWICQNREKPSHIESTCEAVSDAGDDFLIYMRQSNIRAPRIISKSQKFCRHKEAAKEAAEKKNAISTIEKIA